MLSNYSNKNLQKAEFHNQELVNANFSQSDLRGADFSGSNLTGADFSHAKTGITAMNTAWLFIAALLVSLISGYIAMMTGHAVQQMLAAKDPNVRIAGIVNIVLTLLLIAYAWWKGGGTAIKNLILPASVIALLAGLVSFLTGAGTGLGMVYLVVVNILVVLMFVVGTVARAAAGTLSSTILFVIVALGGGMFGKSVGGGIGTVIMAISCAVISKKALSGAKGFEGLRRIAHSITSKFGTSFRNTTLSQANFSGSKIRNSDFSNSDISTVNWGDSKKINCVIQENRTGNG